MEEIDQPVAPSETAESLKEAIEAIDKIGFPVIIRAAFALGGSDQVSLKTWMNLKKW